MALHDRLFPDLLAAMRGQPVKPLKNVKGSVNYRKMARGAAYIADPSSANRRAFLDLLERQKEDGHLCLIGPWGVAYEAGATGMHWTFNAAPVVGVLTKALAIGDEKMVAACVSWLLDEIGLDRHFRYQGRVCFPAPRIKDEKKQAPLDGYRDVFTALALGEKVRKGGKYWQQDQAIAVSALRDLLARHPKILAGAAEAPVPKLYVPIEKRDLPDGGFIAWIPETEEARAVLAKDACHAVRCSGDGFEFWYDWSPVPELEAA